MNLRDQTIRGVAWVSVAKAISQLFSWLITIILARMLLPDDFGVLAMAWLVVGFLDLVSELGVGAVIIQKRDLDEIDLDTIFWLALLIGCCFYGLTYGLAPTIGSFFGAEALADILPILALIFIIGAMRTIPANLLTKELSFGKIAIAECTSVVIGGVVSVGLAIAGYGIWSLVYGAVIRNVLLTLLSCLLYPWVPRLVVSLARMRQILQFGMSIAASRILRYIYTNTDRLIVGKMLGGADLGYYSMAVDLSHSAVQHVTSTVNKVAFPVFSKLQYERERLGTYFYKIARSVALVSFPSTIGLALVADTLVPLLGNSPDLQ